MPLSAGTKLGTYEVVSAIGAGGMGEVYQAHDTKLGRDVAIKVLPEAFAHDPERLSRFQREAKLLASLNHPNIATIHGLEDSSGTSYLVMELVPGDTLAQRIKRDGAVPVEEALAIAKQIAEALEGAHEKGIIHRDLKPANVKLTPEGKVKVLDFGLAKAFEGDPSSVDMSNSPTLSQAATMQGVILGTAAYMSPEQARGRAVDKRTDIWAFGCVLFELLTGKQTFHGEDVTDILAAVVRAEPDWKILPAATPQKLRDLLRRCLQKDKTLRLRDAGDARIEIQDILTAPVVADPALPQRQLPIGWIVAAVLMLVLAAVSFVHFRETQPEVHSARFNVFPPAKANLSNAPQVVAISPDGTQLAFQAQPVGGANQQLWIRPLDSLTAQPLAGTEGASQQFWSWDSRYVAFYADGKLKKIAVTGGPAQVLCDADAALGAGSKGSWNKEGVILFGSGRTTTSDVVSRVSAAGGAPTAVTTLDTAQGELGHAWPRFLPDGNHFLYLAQNRDSAKSAIRVGSLDSKESRLLLNAQSMAAYVPPGYLLYLRDGTLMAQPFDAKALHFTGDAFPVAEQVQWNPGNGRVAFDASENGVLVYRSGSNLNTQMAWFDRSGKELSRIGEPGGYVSPKLSPDEKQVAVYHATDLAVSGDIWVFNLARNTQTRLTFDPADHSNPLWSPDGSHFAFTSKKNNSFEIYQKNSNGTGEGELLLKPSGSIILENWSQDGRFLTYATTEGGGRDLSFLPLAGDRKPVSYLKDNFLKRHSQLSPDGHWMAYISNESGSYQVYVQSFPAGGGKWQVSTTGGVQPRWQHDGKELYYLAPDGKLMAVVVKTGTNFEAGTPEALFQTHIFGLLTSTLYSQQYDVTSDGQRFLIDLDLSDTNGNPLTVVTNWTAGLKK